MSRREEVDAYLEEALRRHPDVPDGMAEERRTREAVCVDWLEQRIEGIASLVRTVFRLARFRRTRVLRKHRGLESSDALIHGALALDLANPNRFAEPRRRGVGRHRTLGYGMLLLRPPETPMPGR